VGYGGAACGDCSTGYYHYNASCKKCPDSAVAVVIVFILAALAACGVTWMMNKYRLDLPLIAVAVDYFQVVSLFAQSKITWPSAVQTLFSIMSGALL
jgi:hypothetical protein